MMRIRRTLVALAMAGALAGGTAGFSAVGAAADYGSGAVYQIGLSFNCMNKTLCQASAQNPFGIGGFWGWIELDRGGIGAAELLGQGHSNTNPILNGTVKLSLSDITWITVQTPQGPALAISAPELGPQPMFLPATPGNYDFSFGPGTQSVIQIALVG